VGGGPFPERVGEVVGGADPEQLGGDAKLLRFGLRRRAAHLHGEIVLVPQQRHRMNARDRLLEELQTLGGKVACHLRHARYVTARMREALNHPGLDGVAGVHHHNRYAWRALHGGERGGIPAGDQEIDFIGDHSIHRIRKPLQPPLCRESLKDDGLAFDVTAAREGIIEARRQDTTAGYSDVHKADAKDLCG
jgi:hypothetical protein